MRKGLLKEIFNCIKKYDVIYIARHIGPDPDAIASQIALKEAILETFSNKKVYAVGSPAARFKYLGKLDKVATFDTDGLLITLDVPDKKRIDGLDINIFKNIIKIDHHPFVEKFSNMEYIDESSTSASEMVLELINNTKLKCNEEIAKKLFIGIVSDTNRFMFYPTSSKVFEIVGNLIKKYNIDIQQLYKKVYLRPLSEVRLMGYIASNMKVTKNKFAYIELENDIISSFNADAASASNMVNDLNNINEILVWMFITYDEKNELFKINIRSRGPIINEIASKYNGGGHKFASGVRIKDKEKINDLIFELDEVCKNYIAGEEKEERN